jgi:glycerol uptake facilitator protein
MIEAFRGEFIGTMTLIVFGNGVVASTLLKKSKGETGGWLAITTGWFIAVMMGVFAAQSAGSINADINPAITLAKYYLHQYSLDTTLHFIAAQCAGAFIGAIIVWLSYLPHWAVTKDAALKRMSFCTAPAIRHYLYNLICEIIGTIVLVMGIAALFGKATLNGPASGLGPYLVGVLVWGIGLSLGGPTGYAINPARDFGPRLAHAILPLGNKQGSDWSYAWVPILGPCLGGALGAYLSGICFL